ncbi:cob(I)yrinic acid a,c-diamide adenosyltransferase [Psychrobacter sanguinis]|uniref:cob(I)yrinic acid a,c-diamide adenosyltransferase n=1 Tax=Psychrobacter sanguinis TaxID=861445 RepID=UPI001918B8ED|nr:cob(I)yrinic acid a,c-diamide adenosyltransferase [Psychrobacter sanguinis]MCC3307682.1 cob(I)yrinic acid a,c-diamide adenosyltransferase [Psychrobacter sanguinis]MCC3344595.1 cob(I)yrinic acid a,c-diamide adenosyltransferase [Psychrobacter sanguinis]MDY3306665.1 cob(I)yrinic acid a,c-diamide adenosyltransferase [Psychrobacter sanguinis]UEC25002.1 cob(I)yrinic acid a,c-diamide adenosyltransferase [Psychrobacter sanguinis]
MGNRLTKIYTRTGDDGTTGLADGSRVSKSDLIFVVMGDVDELNAHIGMILAQINGLTAEKVEAFTTISISLSTVQHLLFNVGGELAMPEYIGISEAHISWLESEIDAFNEELPALKDFILPAGSTLVSQIHIARTVCRRAERQAVNLQLNNKEAISANALKLLNRLSDWLFVLSRYCAKVEGSKEVLWDKTILTRFD